MRCRIRLEMARVSEWWSHKGNNCLNNNSYFLWDTWDVSGIALRLSILSRFPLFNPPHKFRDGQCPTEETKHRISRNSMKGHKTLSGGFELKSLWPQFASCFLPRVQSGRESDSLTCPFAEKVLILKESCGWLRLSGWRSALYFKVIWFVVLYFCKIPSQLYLD